MPDPRLRQLVQDLYETHVAFQKEIAKGHRWVEKGKERGEIVTARTRFHDALNHLFVAKLRPLRDSFLNDAESSADRVIDFLEIDIPAFRCGYEKEWYLRKLKSIRLNADQRARLQVVALKLVASPHFRREFRDWCRLMIVYADRQFFVRLQEISSTEDHFVHRKASLLLEVIRNSRHDLSQSF